MRTPKLSWSPTAFSKTILRSIRGSLGRFLAIVGIVALGCGFYAGLQMSGPDMREAADALYDGTNLYDIRVVSTLGFSSGDVDRLLSVKGVTAAMAARSCDVMARLGDEQVAVRMSSLNVDAAEEGEEQGANVILSQEGNYLNRVFLREGRWPQGASECVVTADKNVAGVKEGDVIEVLYGTTDLDDQLHERRFEVVGSVSSSNYPYTGSFGSTTLGSGVVNEYVFVAPAAFVDDAPFTEIYLCVEGADEVESGSEAYQEAVDEVRTRLEGRREQFENARLEDLTADARQEVAEGREELARKRAETDAELSDAKARLDVAAQELSDGQAQYDEGVAQYEQGRVQAQERMAATQRSLDDRRVALDASRAGAQSRDAELDALERELYDWMAERGMIATSLTSARLQLEARRSQLSMTISSYDDNQQRIDELERHIDELEAQLEAWDPVQDLRSTWGDEFSWMLDTKWALSGQEALREQIDKLRTQLSEARAEAQERVEQNVPTREELDAERTLVTEELAVVDQLRTAREELVRTRLGFGTELAQIEASQAVLDYERSTADTQLAEGKAQLDDAYAKLEEGRRSYEEGLAEYERGRSEADQLLGDAERQLDDAQAAIDEVEPPEIYLLDRSQNEGTLTYDADSHRMDSIANVFPIMFFFVAALVALTTMTRMVDDERVEIGTYKALGYSTGRIASKYLVYAGTASFVGSLVGILALSQLLPFVVMSSYSTIYTVPLHGLPLPVRLDTAVVSGALGMGTTLLATWAAVLASLREAPATLMLPRAPAAGKRILLEMVGPVWRHLSFSWKVTCRNLFRYKRRLAMTVIGIAGCTALLLVGYGVHDAIWDIIDCQYGPIVHYDTIIGLNDEATELDVAEVMSYLDNRRETTTLARVQQENMLAASTADEEKMRVQVVIPCDVDEISRAVTFRERVSQEPVSFGDESVLITEKVGLKYGLAEGDEILLFEQDAIGNPRGSGHRLRVTGVVENYVGNYVYVGREAWRKVDNTTPVFSRLYVSVVGDAETRSSVGDDLRAHDKVSTVEFTTETVNLYRNMLSVVDSVVFILIASAGLLAFIVLYNLTNINIGERVREIASLKVLGFTRREVYAYIFREIALLAVLGDALGLALGTWLATFVVITAEVDYVMFGRTIHAISYVYSFVLTLVFVAAILVLMRRKLDRVNMVESLKSVE